MTYSLVLVRIANGRRYYKVIEGKSYESLSEAVVALSLESQFFDSWLASGYQEVEIVDAHRVPLDPPISRALVR